LVKVANEKAKITRNDSFLTQLRSEQDLKMVNVQLLINFHRIFLHFPSLPRAHDQEVTAKMIIRSGSIAADPVRHGTPGIAAACPDPGVLGPIENVVVVERPLPHNGTIQVLANVSEFSA
jgi:hypothetical protein